MRSNGFSYVSSPSTKGKLRTIAAGTCAGTVSGPDFIVSIIKISSYFGGGMRPRSHALGGVATAFASFLMLLIAIATRGTAYLSIAKTLRRTIITSDEPTLCTALKPSKIEDEKVTL